jgi:hypothetical protein
MAISQNVLLAKAILACAGTQLAFAQATFTFSNSCSTNDWHTVCNSAGNWTNNWGVFGPSQFAVPFPGPLDTANLFGSSIIATSNIDVAKLNVPASTTLTLGPMSFSMGFGNTEGLQLSGTARFSPGATFFDGSITTAPGSTLSLDGTTLQSVSSTTQLWQGAVSLQNGASVNRWTGGAENHVIDVRTPVTVSTTSAGPVSLFSNVTVTGTTAGSFVVQPQAELRLDNVRVFGSLRNSASVGGTTSFTSLTTADAPVSLLTGPSLVPWKWRGGSVTSSVAAPIDNLGLIETVPGTGNRFITGKFTNTSSTTSLRLVGADGGLFHVNDFTLSNLGTISFVDGADITLWTGTRETKLLDNQRFVTASASTGNTDPSVISNMRIQGSAASSWAAIDPAAILRISNCELAGSFPSNHLSRGELQGISLFADVSLSTQTPSSEPWQWIPSTIDTGAFRLTNLGKLTAAAPAGQRFIKGNFRNQLGADWRHIADANLFTVDSLFFVNDGTFTLLDSADIISWTGVATNKTFVNNGTLSVGTQSGSTPGTSTISDIRLRSGSQAGVSTLWTVANATLRFSNVLMEGNFVANVLSNGTLDIGTVTLSGITSIRNAGVSAPWTQGPGSINTDIYSFSNDGSISTAGPAGNRFLTGTFFNAGLWTVVEGTGLLTAGAVTFQNQGTLNLQSGASINNWTGAPSTKSMDNSGTINITNTNLVAPPTTFFGGFGVVNNAFRIEVQPDALASFAAGTYTHTSTNALLRSGTNTVVTLPNNTTIDQGSVEPSGRIDTTGTFQFNGTAKLNPAGDNVGQATIQLTGFFDRLNMSGTSELICSISNPPGVANLQATDRIDVIGQDSPSSLDGTLRIRFAPGTVNVRGQEHVIMTFNNTLGITGTAFANVVTDNPLPDVRYLTRIDNNNQVILRIAKRCGTADIGSQGGDANFDGILDNNDFAVFVTLFFNADPRSDVGQQGGLVGSDGAFDNNDFAAFVTLFFLGCF